MPHHCGYIRDQQVSNIFNFGPKLEFSFDMKSSLQLILAFVCLLPFAFANAMQIGSIQGQDGWSGGQIVTIGAAVDQEVTNAASYAGYESFRVSNKGYNGMFDGWLFGPPLANAAGQPSAGAAANVLAMTLFFRSVSTTADGSNLELDLGNSTGNDRTTFTAITNFADSDGGLTLRAAEPNATTGDFYPTNLVAPGLSRTAWHQLDIVAYFLDGAGNDYFQIFLDDPTHANPIVSPNTHLNQWGTFEAYNAAQTPPGATISLAGCICVPGSLPRDTGRSPTARRAGSTLTTSPTKRGIRPTPGPFSPVTAPASKILL
jgi:hypothetical protein